MSDHHASIERALEAHEAFTPIEATTDSALLEGQSYDLQTTVFETSVGALADGRVHATIVVPTLDAAVADQTVAPIVEEGWLETFERRLEDVFSVATAAENPHHEIEYEPASGVVCVTLEYDARRPGLGVADAKALLEYVEGTYAQGIIPGYTYRGPAETLLENAIDRGEEVDRQSWL